MRCVTACRRLFLSILCVLLLNIAACSSAHKKGPPSETEALQQNAPIQTTGGLFPSYEQNQKPVSTLGLIQELKKDETTKSKAETAEILNYSSLGLATVGGIEVGRGVVKTFQNQGGMTDLLVGSGALGASLVTKMFATRSLQQAVEEKNKTIGTKTPQKALTSSSLFIEPQVEFGRYYFPKVLGLGAGLKLTF